MTRRLVRKLLSLPVVAKGPMNTPTMLLPEELAQRIRECGDALTEHFSINPIDATELARMLDGHKLPRKPRKR